MLFGAARCDTADALAESGPDSPPPPPAAIPVSLRRAECSARVFPLVAEFIRGILRRPPSFTGALEGCERLIQRAHLEHLSSKACPRDEGPSDGGGSDAEDGYDQSGSQPDDSESGDCDTDSARDAPTPSEGKATAGRGVIFGI